MPIFNGNIKIKLSGIKDAYFGTVKIYSSVVPVTITYSTEHGTAPASKVVNSGYVLTADDLPELTDSGYKFLGWDVSAGTVVTSDMTITAAWSARQLVSIELSGQKTSIDRKQAFDFGGTVTAAFDNGTTEDVTSSTTFSGYDMSVAGTYDVVASYTSGEVTKSANYSLIVNKIWESVLKKPYGPLDLQSTREADGISLTSSSFSTDEAKNRPLRITWSLNLHYTVNPKNVYYRTFATSDTQYPNTNTPPDNPFSGTPTWGDRGDSSRSYPLLRIDEGSWHDGSKLYIKWDNSLRFYGSGYSPRGYLTIENIEQYF